MVAFNPRKFTSPDRLKTISPARLRAFLSPWRDYLVERGFAFPEATEDLVDCATLAQVLMTPDRATPRDLIDALYYVHETASTEDMDELIADIRLGGLSISEDPKASPADLAIDVWLLAPDTLRARHAEAIAKKQQNFEYFGPEHAAPRDFPDVGKALQLQIQAQLDIWFEEHRRGTGCRIFVFRHSHLVWILIRHGLPMRREAGHQDNGEATTEFYRPQQHDVLIYDERTGEMGVHANTKGERNLYLQTLGLLLFEDENHFPSSAKFTLDPLVADGVESVDVEDIEGVKSVRLVEFRRYWGGPQKEMEIRKAENIFAALSRREAANLGGGRLVSATFKVRFEDSDKERSVTIRPPGIARYDRNEDSELVDLWLRDRKFIKQNQDTDDDEDATSVLEST